MRFVPVTPDRLIEELAGWIHGLTAEHPVVGFDGAAEVGAATLADAVAGRVRALGRPVVRVSTRWWWRPASLRLELGRTDLDMLLSGWVDTAALRRELLDPLRPGGSGRYLRRLRDPQTDRSLREERIHAAPGSVVLLDGPFLQASGLDTDTAGLRGTVYLQVSTSTLHRSLPSDRRWWVEAFERYRDEDLPAGRATAVIAYDHPAAPAIDRRRGPEGDPDHPSHLR